MESREIHTSCGARVIYQPIIHLITLLKDIKEYLFKMQNVLYKKESFISDESWFFDEVFIHLFKE